jgi:hypothetical protein
MIRRSFSQQVLKGRGRERDGERERERGADDGNMRL